MGWGAALGVASSVIGGLASAKGASDQNQANQQMAKQQMAFQERMSNTAHQREVKDLRAAGLNPILSATGGPGASSPTGATAENKNVLGEGVNSAMSTMRTMADAFKAQAEANYVANAKTAQTEAATTESYASAHQKTASARQAETSADLNLSHINLNDNQINNLQQQLKNLQQTENLTRAQTSLTYTQAAQGRATINNLQEQFKDLKMKGDISASEYGRLMEIAKRATDNLGNIPSLKNALKSITGGKKSPVKK
jgi:hypothetical protein